jgi:hypothetical protein
LDQHIATFPRALTIDVSMDGVDWHEVQIVQTGVMAVVGAMQRSNEIRSRWPF